MANPTGFITNKSPYVNNDLNTVFAPINNVDYGTLSITSTNPADPNTYIPGTTIGETWRGMNVISSEVYHNVHIHNDISGEPLFVVLAVGVYKLCITMSFLWGTQTTHKMVFTLVDTGLPNADNTLPGSINPSPKITQIYSINVNGGQGVSGSSVDNNLNGAVSIGGPNLLSFGPDNTIAYEDQPYFVYFQIVQSTNSADKAFPNLYTIEITFRTTGVANIKPCIRCAQEAGNDPSIQLQYGKWMFMKIA